jgi:hypothetical protein
MNSLAQRTIANEQMDAEAIDPAVYAAVLRDLAKVNRWTFTAPSACSTWGSDRAICCGKSPAGQKSAGSQRGWSASISTR